MKKILFLLLVSFGCLLVWPQMARADTTWESSSLTLGLDARSFGMGGACLAVIDSWANPINPAALPFLTRQGVFAGRFVNPTIDPWELRGDQSYLQLGYLHPDTGNGAYSLTAFTNRYLWQYNIAPGFEHLYTELKVLQYGYGYGVSGRLSLGFNLRRVAQVDEINVGDLRNSYFNSYLSFDAGAVFRLNSSVTAALLVTDLFSPKVHLDLDTDGDGETEPYYYEVKPRILFGGAIRLGEFFLLAVDVDGNFANYDELLAATRLGVEFCPLHFLALRAGYYHGQATMGFGFKLGQKEGMEIALDFGQYWPEGEALVSPVQTMGMTVRF